MKMTTAGGTGRLTNRSHGPPLEGPQGPSPPPAGVPQPSLLRDLLALLIKTALIAGTAILIFTFLYGLHRSAEPAMKPAVRDGDLVMFYRLDKSYAARDLLLLDFQGERQVRRVVATEGDTVDITENGLVINGAIQQELNIYEETYRYAEGVSLPITLGEGEVFVLGDARENASDSRVYGAVRAKDTLGTVIAIMKSRNL